MRWKWLFFYWKRLLKSKLYIGASFSFFLLLTVRFTLFFTDPYNMESYGDILHEVFMLVQIVSLFYIVWFYGKAQAVTLIKGQGHQLVDLGYEITYPADWPHMAERAPTVIRQMEKTFRHVQQIASTAVSSLPNRIVFSSSGLSSFMAHDHLVYNTNFFRLAPIIWNEIITHISHPNKVKTKDFLFHFLE
ncbi:hypothetical protein BJQ97_01245 [Geobacillus sp. TFV-3]|nr:hypothetical protein BJQ97_01245 [Geobacillus sp. TFV-3]